MDQETKEKYNYILNMLDSIQNLNITKIYQLASNRYQDNYIDIIIPDRNVTRNIDLGMVEGTIGRHSCPARSVFVGVDRSINRRY